MEIGIEIGKLAKVIRSKNAGPFKITFDIIFDDLDTYEKVKRSPVLNKEVVSRLYKLPENSEVSIIHFDPAYAIKITFLRRVPSGNIGDCDIYGAQQHVPLYNLKVQI